MEVNWNTVGSSFESERSTPSPHPREPQPSCSFEADPQPDCSRDDDPEIHTEEDPTL